VKPWKALVPLMCGLFLLVTAEPAFGQLLLLAPALPSPADVVKVIDHLTKKDSETSVDVKLGKTTRQGKLLVARTKVDVGMERSSRNWRGRVVVHMTVPSEVSYSVDLTTIRPEHIRLEEKSRRLIVAMPTPQVEAVTPALPEVRVKNDFNQARFKRLDGDTSRELQNVMLREDYQAKARKKAEEQLPQIRDQGRVALEAFLQKMLIGSFPGLKVVVE
jgi:Protein of unknown function (DUF4230)